MGTRTPSHQLSSGLYVSGPPEQLKERQPTMASRAVPYTGGDPKKSGELGKMFDIPSSNAPPLKPSRTSSSSQHSSGQVRSASSSGPIGRQSGSGPMPRKSSGPIPLQPTVLITSGSEGSGPMDSSGGGRRSGQLDQAGSMGKAVYGSAVTSLNDEMNVGFRLSKAIVWVFMVLVAMGLLVGVFLMVAVKRAAILVALGGTAVPVLVLFVWNCAWGRRGLLGFVKRYPDVELRGAIDGQYVKVTGVVTCGSIPLESSYQKVPRCVYVSTELFEYRGWGGRSANPKHRCFTWGSRYCEVLPALREKHGEFLLRELVKRWESHKIMYRCLYRFFGILDRFYVGRWSRSPLHVVGLTCFRELVYKEMNGKMRDAVISLIDQEREGEKIDHALLKSVLDIFIEVGMGKMDCYGNDFEAAMLRETSSYYSKKASKWIFEDSYPDYMLKVVECLKREKDRIAHYLHSSTEPKLLEKVQHELVSVYAIQLLEKEHSGCHALLKDKKVEDLSRMFRVFSEFPQCLDHVSSIFKEHVTTEGMALVELAEDAASDRKVFVRKVIELHVKYVTHVNECFQNHTLFHKALKDAFEVFCNKDVAGGSSAELFATFCDNILKKGGSEKLSDGAIDETLEKVVKLLAYISDKDLFAEFYRKKLARRLLFDKSANVDSERSILTKLKRQCGDQLTSKMAGMVTDLALARENQASFEEYLSNNPNADPGIDLTVTVLSAGHWPSYKSIDLKLPAEMKRCVEVFKDFYQTKTKRQQLTWIYSLGTCNISGEFEPKTMELIVTTYQAAALLLFNSSDRLSYSEIKNQLNLSDGVDVTRLLYSLSCSKYKILSKEPNTKSISCTDYFEFNSKFTDKKRRIKIPLLPVVEKKKVIKVVDKYRKCTIDVTILRVMKSRKVLSRQQLVKECVEQLGRIFTPDVKSINQQVQHLIFREYLAIDKRDAKLVKYLP